LYFYELNYFIMHLDKLAGIIRSLFHRLLGSGGTKIVEATTGAGRFHTLYVAQDATFSAVTGGGDTAAWITTIPAGTTLTTPAGDPVTSFTISAGIVAAYS
jgi:hypothetical protein